MSALDDLLKLPGINVDIDAMLKLRQLVLHIPERNLAPAGMPGGFVTKRRGRGMETNDIRVFSYGDDIRHVDHNTTARTGVTHVRTFHDEREKTALLIADFRPSMLWGTRRVLRSVAAAEALVLAGWRIIEGGGRVGLIALSAVGPVVVPARGREHGMLAVIGGLAAAHQAALEASLGDASPQDPSLDGVLEMAARMVPSGGSVLLASALDDPGDGFTPLANSLNIRAQLTILLILDAFETSAPTGAYPVMAESGKIRWARFGKGRENTSTEPRRVRLDKMGIPTVPIDAGKDPETIAEELSQIHGLQ